ncbi:MAG: ATP phosphoribosyltransferase regulatory subunit, partial [Dehalococcoidia bacterium]|nr:ATP phosphoribosyltransferase regulatory subunit [Dehalococcoidia bacterium]
AVEGAPSILDFLDDEDAAHFESVKSALDAVGIAYEVDPYIVRGLDYYSRTVWEFEPPEARGQSTIGAGGRYDGLIELLGGQPTPGVGFATGIERIALNLKNRGIEPPEPESIDVVTVPLGEAGATACLRVARDLRAAGLTVRGGTPGRSMKAALRAADASGAADAVIIGDREAADGVATLKPLRGDAEQRTVAVTEVAEAIRA